MRRDEVVQAFLGRFHQPSYLEIGVNEGETFFQLTAARKVAVDPHFKFDFRSHQDETAVFHEITSDEYFASRVGETDRFDVIYIDGLHTFEQTLRDLLNSVCFLKENGVIVIDDVIPNSYDASLPDFGQVAMLRRLAATTEAKWDYDGSWMGDVFKLVFFIKAFMQQWSYATVAENHGQTALWRQARPVQDLRTCSVEEVSRLDYRDTILQRDVFQVRPLAEILLASADRT